MKRVITLSVFVTLILIAMLAKTTQAQEKQPTVLTRHL
jgi:hypothetical protein